MSEDKIIVDAKSPESVVGRWERVKQTWIFILLNVIFWALLSSQYFRVENAPATAIGSLFSVTFSLGHFLLVGLLLWLINLPGQMLVKNRRALDLMRVASAVAVTSLLVSDIVVHSLFKMHISPALVGIFLAASPFEIYDPPTSFYLTVILGFATLCVAEYGILRLARLARRGINLPLSLALVACFLTYNSIHAMAAFNSYIPVLLRSGALPYAYPLTAKSFLQRRGFKSDDVREWDDGAVGAGLDYPKKPLEITPPDEKLNVIVILIDSWRVDSFNETVMPLVHRRARGGQVFTRHFSGGNATRCGVFSLFYGLPATYFHSFYANRRGPVLIDQLREQGYEFGIFPSAGLESVNIDHTALASFDQVPPAPPGRNSGERDVAMENMLMDFVKTRDGSRPYFAFAFYDILHSHAPFPDLPQPFVPANKNWNYLEFNNAVDPTPYLNMYKNAVYTLDIRLDALLSGLQDAGVMENTVVILTGDHGEEFNDTRTNTWSHNSNFTVYQAQVPMVVFWPGRLPAVHSYLTRHYDLAPTLMEDALGFRGDPSVYTLGVNLFSARDRDYTLMASYSDNAILYGHTVFVLKKFGMLKTYDLQGGDSGEKLPPNILQKALFDMKYFLRERSD
ncbi:MAG: DUF3413 domain-containing protein [Deltaproteobacteria bacterium]|jgi:membrane-anchored protein YejM (alkaline phosphatase superfamily)|nr:DUF3413 domain-containing protein [Deltaproteobacteria bacterium]